MNGILKKSIRSFWKAPFCTIANRTTVMYPIPQKYSIAFMLSVLSFTSFFALRISSSALFFSLRAFASACSVFFSASFCFLWASSTASTDDLFTCICNLEFWSRTSSISSSSCSCSLLLIKPFLFLRSSLLC